MPRFSDAPELSARAGFAGAGFDRLSESREDQGRLSELRAHPAARVAVFVNDAPLLERRRDACRPFLSFAAAQDLGAFAELVLLGADEQGPLFAASLASSAPPARSDLIALDLRSLAMEGLVEAPVLGVLAEAKSLLYWHGHHRFCGACGRPTDCAAAGWRRQCAACGAAHFPRTDPVVIMLAVHGDRCLLGRQTRSAPGVYSALAGFVEPGETVENAVRREVMEEAGLAIGRVQYVGSQPWPFPSSLMLGCMAEALSCDVTPDGVELEDVRWFTRADVRAMLAKDHPDGLRAPNPIAIAYCLLETWLLD